MGYKLINCIFILHFDTIFHRKWDMIYEPIKDIKLISLEILNIKSNKSIF